MSCDLQNLDYALEILGLALGELVAARSHGARRGSRAQEAKLFPVLAAHVHELFQQDPFNAVPRGVDLADLVREREAPLDDTLQGRIDDGRRPAGLSHQNVSFHRAVIPQGQEAENRCHLLTDSMRNLLY